MGEIETYFFDTYAFYEILKSNLNYQKYSGNVSIVTTNLNLMELHYGLLRLYGKETADKNYNYLKQFCIEIDDDTIKEANSFKLLNKKKNLSYVDCIGYIMAKKLGIKFLTGDSGFEKMENVEFVK